jgi:UDP-galactopyranose mutase
MYKKILIVGTGLSGSVIARELAENGYQVLLIDKRDHVGGNIFDFINEQGIRIHKYGPHLFHTNNESVFVWLSKFTSWHQYRHKVKAMLSDGRLVTLPVNAETVDIVGRDNIINTFIRPYSEKMWNLKLEEIDDKIIQRVPIRNDNNELYFPNDKFQVVPVNGYTSMIQSILNHENISYCLNTEFSKNMERNYFHIFNSMPIDEYFDFKFGELPYRSIKFETITLPLPKIFPVAVVNFTHESKYTRITEWKNILGHGINNKFTTLTYEEPCDYKENNFERYYPVKDKLGINKKLYNKYKSIEHPKMTFIGRLGQYLYLDMDQVVSSSLAIVHKFIQNAKG